MAEHINAAINRSRPERAWADVSSKACCETPCEGQNPISGICVHYSFKPNRKLKTKAMIFAKFKYAILDLILVFLCSLAVIIFVI